MAKSGNGNTGTATSASQAQSQAASANAANSNAANGNTGTGNTSNTSGTSGDGKGNAGSTNTSTNTSTSNNATNAAGLMGSLIGFGNAIAKGEVGNNSSGSTSGNNTETSNKAPNIPGYAITEQARAEERGKNFLNPSFEYGTTHYDNNAPADTFAPATTNNAPADTSAPATTPAANNAPGGNLGGETGGIADSSTETAAPSISETLGGATNTGVTYRGGTVTTPSGTSVTDSGTGGSISSSIATPTRDASSIGLGVYNNDRANYDQDNWNRGMEAESSSLVSDEECKAFAKRAFMENSEPFKKVRITIIKNVR